MSDHTADVCLVPRRQMEQILSDLELLHVSAASEHPINVNELAQLQVNIMELRAQYDIKRVLNVGTARYWNMKLDDVEIAKIAQAGVIPSE